MKYLFLCDNEAVLAAQGKLTAIVRVMKPQPEYYMGSGWWCSWYRHYGSKEKLERDIIPYAPFLPGAIVPAKETWTLFIRGDGEHGFKRFIKYAADGEEIEVHDDKWEWWERQEKNGWGWRSPILMPAAAVRHRFLIKSVKAMLALDIQTLTEKEIFHCESSHDFWKANHIKDTKCWIWYAEIEASDD